MDQAAGAAQRSSPWPQLEFETRYFVTDQACLLRELELAGFRAVSQSLILDDWFAPPDVIDFRTHETWLASSQARPVRMRTTQREGFETTLEVKRPLKVGDYSANAESAVRIDNVDAGHAFLEELGLRRIIRTERHRSEWVATEVPLIRVALDAYTRPWQVFIVEIEAAQAFVLPKALSTVLAALVPVTGSAALYFIRAFLQDGEPGRPLMTPNETSA